MARLQDLRNVTLDILGDGFLRFGPQHPNHTYRIERVSVAVTTQVKEATARIYKGSIGPSFLSATFTASSGDTDDGLNVILYPGEYLTVYFTGGDAGAVASAGFWGTINDVS